MCSLSLSHDKGLGLLFFVQFKVSLNCHINDFVNRSFFFVSNFFESIKQLVRHSNAKRSMGDICYLWHNIIITKYNRNTMLFSNIIYWLFNVRLCYIITT